ncbi:MAG: Hsp70 family protein [Pirellulaceae bacterium]|nr:Hsp70 family protein [Pirellulaceae bacterium]
MSATPPNEPPRPQHDDVTRLSGAEHVEDNDFVINDAANHRDSTSGPIGLLGEYLLLDRIGAGGMGEVFRAEHRTMNRHVAVKILSRKIADSPQLLERFFHEIRAVAKLMHPNIVTAFDAGSQGGVHFLVMELVEGELLSRRIARLGPMSTAEVVHVLHQAADALDYAHRMGIVHRDIKPGNLMLANDGRLKILDFGLATFNKSAGESTPEKKMFMGTPEYMSPEQVEHPDSVDGRSDLYSLGATLFYMIAGRTMFSGEQMQVALAQMRQKPPALYEVRSDVDLRLDAIFQRLVAKNPDDRFANAAELSSVLQQLHLVPATPQAPTFASTSPGTSVVGSSFVKGINRLLGEHGTSISPKTSTFATKIQPVAIDLGMFASTVAHCDAQGAPQILEPRTGSGQHLRNMLWSDGEHIKIGSDASEMRKTQPERIFHSLQRWIGAKEITRTLGGRKATPEALIGAILQQLMTSARGTLPNATHAVVTVPSCYDQMHRRAIQVACQIAGIELLQLLDKPLAVALSWVDVQSKFTAQADSRPRQLLVLHLGGTGLEASLIRAEGTTVKSLGSCGDWQLGSLLWQSTLASFFSNQLLEMTGKSIREDVNAATRLQRTIELAMDRLTRTPKVDVRFDWLGKTIEQSVTQFGFMKLTPALGESITKVIHGACSIAKTEIAKIDDVLLVGSMMHMRPLQDLVRSLVPHVASPTLLEKSDIARGAALQSRYLGSLEAATSKMPHAIASTAYDFGLLAIDPSSGKGSPHVLLEKSSALPTTVSKNLRGELLANIGSLQIIESTRLGGDNWHRLGVIKPSEAFPNRQPQDPLQLRLVVDESGLFEAHLTWPAGNRQVSFGQREHALDSTQIDHWKSWLETALLCSDH